MRARTCRKTYAMFLKLAADEEEEEAARPAASRASPIAGNYYKNGWCSLSAPKLLAASEERRDRFKNRELLTIISFIIPVYDKNKIVGVYI